MPVILEGNQTGYHISRESINRAISMKKVLFSQQMRQWFIPFELRICENRTLFQAS
jgi:hypothetical protein